MGWWKYKISYKYIGKKRSNKYLSLFYITCRNDVIRAMSKTGILGNASIVNKEYVCTVPI